jgi:hypothetical protein
MSNERYERASELFLQARDLQGTDREVVEVLQVRDE